MWSVGLTAVLAIISGSVRAAPLRSVGAGEIAAAVNALRLARGLAAYKIDGDLAAYAQEHAEYMARIDQATHTHSDGSSPGSRGVSENVASGSDGYLTAEFVVNTIWADAIHLSTMVGHTGGAMGVGVASNGTNAYVALEVRPSGGAVGSSGSGSTTTQVDNAAANPAANAPARIAAVATATPRPDGSVVHVVAAGESLWQIAIAYGVTINEILALNNLPADSTTIYEGQKLIIRPPGGVTSVPDEAGAAPEASLTPTAVQVTTPRPTRTTRPTMTAPALAANPASPTPAPTVPVALAPYRLANFHLDGRTILIGFVFGAAAVLLVVFILSFRK